MELKKSKIDVAVLIIFFCRDDKFAKVFEQVRKARPKRLYLYQDGPRENNERDAIGIAACRKIIDEGIDWDCDLHKNYQEKNIGCDPSEYIAQKWFFSFEEMGIILEDDDVPSQSFFPFCKELLVRYKDDDRIEMISGTNKIDVAESLESDYTFIKDIPIWGWASWRRVIDSWDPTYSWLDDPEKIEYLKNTLTQPFENYQGFVDFAAMHRKTGKEYYESLLFASLCFYDRVSIIPKCNMITNIGIGDETTHSVKDLRVYPKKAQQNFYKKRYEIEFPLKHPKEVERNIALEVKMRESYKMNKIDYFEWGMRGLIFGGPGYMKKLISRKQDKLS